TAWLQWAAPITEPDQRSAGLAVFEQDGSLGEGSITILAEDLPLAGSPSLDWYLRDGGLVVELVGPAGATPLAGLGSPADVRSARISAPRADGSITIALVSTSTALPGAGGARCDGAPCAELYRTTLRNGVLASPELLSIGDDGTRIEDDVVGVSLSPNGDLVAFVTATSLLPGLAAAGVANTYVAGAQHLRSISSFEVVDTAVNGGRFPAFLSNNQLVFYADLTSLPAGGVADVPIPGLRIAQIQPFDDMAVTVHEGAIWWAVERGITEGCAVGRYCPTRPLTRGQMASLVARALELAPSGSGPFDDVAGIHAPAINAIAAAGITAGCDANSFCPEDPVSRAQMAAFLARALGLEPLASGSFADAVGVHGGAINAIEAAGISNGCAPGRYCPEVAVTRAQMATFLFRAFSGQPG
ncbi:MAG: S-layer homology domain-containing protein, partial [Acidimicrobiia bacterium]|nr:S-layer homology domain-containing protein [Acidimicrobiia bacterium]